MIFGQIMYAWKNGTVLLLKWLFFLFILFPHYCKTAYVCTLTHTGEGLVFACEDPLFSLSR